MSNIFNETIFLKEDSILDKEIEYLKSIGKVDPIKSRGSYGERQLAYQLKKANEGMFVLRDVNLEYEGMTAQIDFIIITSHHCYFVECKNYTGNIEVNKNGEFVVNTKPGKRNGRIGIKSPINQVEDQREVFKSICLKDIEGTKELLNGIKFNDYFKTLVVFTNQENIIKASYAPKHIRSRIIKVDEIIRYIKRGSELYTGKRLNKEQMKAIGDFFLEKNIEKNIDINIPVNDKDNEHRKTKKNSIVKEAIIGFIGIIIAILVLNWWADIWSKATGTVSNEIKLTEKQNKAIDIMKSAYTSSNKNGFEVVHYSVCKELSSMFSNPAFTCGGLPLEVNYKDNNLTIYKDTYCYTLEFKGKDTVTVKKETRGAVKNDWCTGKMVGNVNWDNNNDYYKKIGGYNKLRELAINYYKNGILSDNYYDYSKILERGGNSQLWNTYKLNVEKFLGGLTGKGPSLGETNTKGFNEMVENYYYIMK